MVRPLSILFFPISVPVADSPLSRSSGRGFGHIGNYERHRNAGKCSGVAPVLLTLSQVAPSFPSPPSNTSGVAPIVSSPTNAKAVGPKDMVAQDSKLKKDRTPARIVERHERTCEWCVGLASAPLNAVSHWYLLLY